jgi:hypothetical protein
VPQLDSMKNVLKVETKNQEIPKTKATLELES